MDMDWERFAKQMASMARDLLAQDPVDSTIARITSSATELVEGCDAAGILVINGTTVESLAPTEQPVVDSDLLQGRCGEGPCFDAARHLQTDRVFVSAISPRNRPTGPPTLPRPMRSKWAT